MEKPDTIEILKDLVPYECKILLASEEFGLRVNYNATADLYTVDLYKDGKLVCAGEPVVYGVPLWSDVYKSGLFPAIDIIPLDLSGECTKATRESLGKTVLLMVDNGEVSLNG